MSTQCESVVDSMWRNVATPLAWVPMMHLVSDRLNWFFGMCLGGRRVHVVCGRKIFLKQPPKMWNNHLHLQWKSHLSCEIISFPVGYFRPAVQFIIKDIFVFVFSAGLFVCSERRWKNKSNWKTFWRAVICYAWTKAGGLTVVLDLIKGEWMMLSYTAESAVCTAHLLQQIRAWRLSVRRLTRRGF